MTLLEEQKHERDNGVAPANAYAQSTNAHTTNDALNNLAAATAADRQAAANQAEAVANLTVSNKNLAQQLQQAQQQLQNMMSTMHSPTTAPGGGYRAPPPPRRTDSPPSFPQYQIPERLTGTEATNLPELTAAGTTRTIARRADTSCRMAHKQNVSPFPPWARTQQTGDAYQHLGRVGKTPRSGRPLTPAVSSYIK